MDMFTVFKMIDEKIAKNRKHLEATTLDNKRARYGLLERIDTLDSLKAELQILEAEYIKAMADEYADKDFRPDNEQPVLTDEMMDSVIEGRYGKKE